MRTEASCERAVARPSSKGHHVCTGNGKDPRGRAGGVSRNRGTISGSGASIYVLTQVLPGILGRPVLDRTGLTGSFDSRLEWAEDASPLGKGGGPDVSPSSEGSGGGPTIFTAIQEQLGLRLEAAKGLEDVVVIERLEKPTAT